MCSSADSTYCVLQLTSLGLSDVTLQALQERGITALFPIQKHVYEPAAAGELADPESLSCTSLSVAAVIAKSFAIMSSWLHIHSTHNCSEQGCSLRKLRSSCWMSAHRNDCTCCRFIAVALVVKAVSRLCSLLHLAPCASSHKHRADPSAPQNADARAQGFIPELAMLIACHTA